MTKSTGVGRGSNARSYCNTKRGAEHTRWNHGKLFSSHGYVKVRVGKDHPLADPNGYAYEHLLVWVSAGNARPAADQVIHHKNENKADNRIANLEMLSRVGHAKQHHKMITDEQVVELRTRYANGETGVDLAAEFGIRFQRAYIIIRGKTRRDAGGPIQSGDLRADRNVAVVHHEFPKVSR